MVEIGEVIILAIVAIATAWSGPGCEMGRPSGLSLRDVGPPRFEAEAADTLGGQQHILDVSTFNTWIQAREQGEDELADPYVRRFSPEYRVAFEAG